MFDTALITYKKNPCGFFISQTGIYLETSSPLWPLDFLRTSWLSECCKAIIIYTNENQFTLTAIKIQVKLILCCSCSVSGQEVAAFAADVFCYCGMKGTGVSNDIKDGCVPCTWARKPCQWVSMHSTCALELARVNGMKPSLIFASYTCVFLLWPAMEMSSVTNVCWMNGWLLKFSNAGTQCVTVRCCSHQALPHRDFILWLSAEVAARLGSKQLREDWQRYGVCVPHPPARPGVSQPTWAAAQMW